MSCFSGFGYGRRRRKLQEETDEHLRMAIDDRLITIVFAYAFGKLTSG